MPVSAAIKPSNDATRDYYRLRKDAWQIRCINVGIKPSVRALAEACGIPKSTLYRVTQGQPPSAATMAALVKTLRASFDDLFETVEHDA